MGWLEGLLSGYADTQSDLRKEAARQAEASASREGDVMKALLNSPDDHVRTLAATGLLSNSQPQKRKSGFAGWMGEMESNPMYPQLMKYISTPQAKTVDTIEPGLPSKQTQGYLPLAPGSSSSLAQTTNSPTEGAPMATPKPLPATVASPPPTPPDASPDAEEPAPPTPEQLAINFNSSPNLTPPPRLTDEERAINFSHLATPPPVPPGVAPSAAAAAAAAAPPVTAATPTPGATPPPAPPQGLLTTRDVPGPAVGRVDQHTTYALPHAFPTVEDTEVGKVHAEISALQQAYREQGDPDWQKKGTASYMAQHARTQALPYKVVNVEFTDPATGKIAEDLGIFDAASGRFFSQDGVTPLPADARPVAKVAAASTAPLKIEDEAAANIGYPGGSHTVPPADLARYRAEVNRLQTSASGAKAAGTSQGRYEEEKRRVDPAAADYAAHAIAADASLSSAVLGGHSQAFKDAVIDRLANTEYTDPVTGQRMRGITIQKLDDSTRQMASMAKDILPQMDTIAADAKALNNAGAMGVIQSRWNDFVTGTLGAADAGITDPAVAGLFAKFRTETAMLQTAVNKAHMGARGAGSPTQLEHMQTLLSASHMDYPTFISSMAGFKGWMDQYAQHLPDWGRRGVEADEAPALGAPPAPPAATPARTAAAPAAAPPGAPPASMTMVNGVLYKDGKPF